MMEGEQDLSAQTLAEKDPKIKKGMALRIPEAWKEMNLVLHQGK